MNGFLIIDKPSGVTSRDMVNALQKRVHRKTKLGHAGTLDPLATGVLVVAVGSATRLIEYVQDRSKTYLSTFRFGARSDTDDADGNVTITPDASPIDESTLANTLAEFVGVIDQTPPVFSAVHVDGQRAYELARKGKDVSLTAKPVRVDAIRLLSYSWPDAVVEIDCGKGTYIRSIARDVGEKLGVGGMVQTLRRTRIGDFTPEEALSPDFTRPEIAAKLLPLGRAVDHLPNLEVDEETALHLFQGRIVTSAAEISGEAALFCKGRLVGIGAVESGRLRAVKMLRD